MSSVRKHGSTRLTLSHAAVFLTCAALSAACGTDRRIVGGACADPLDCVDGLTCIVSANDGVALGRCTRPCTSTGELCDAETNADNESTGATVCAPVDGSEANICYLGGVKALGDTCEGYGDCGAGLLCVTASSTAPKTCEKGCELAAPDCAAEQTCTNAGTLGAPEFNLGVCITDAASGS